MVKFQLKHNYAFIFILFCFSIVTSEAQEHRCGDHLVKKSMEEKYPGYLEAISKTFEEAKIKGARGDRGMDSYTIDVVVHIVYQDEEQNLHDSIILSQIATLNEDFNRLNEDAINVRPDFENRVASANIQFRLTDIIRVQTTSKFRPDFLGGLPDNVKVTGEGGSNAVDPITHLNIWVCKLEPIEIGGIPLGQVLGYAYPPADLPNWPAGVSAPSPGLDGVVVDYRIFGRNNPLTIDPGTGEELSGYGRTAVHEVGHYLGLRHIWGDGGFFGDGCQVDDGVEDTPNQASASNWACNYNQNSCPNDADLDMIENFMDYSNETCMNSFTRGQIEIMRGVLEGPRIGLIENNVSVIRKDFASLIMLYPNPLNGTNLNIDIRGMEEYDLRLEIYNSVGIKVTTVDKVTNGSNISLNAIAPGIYYARFVDKNNSQHWTTKKLIKY